MMKKSKDVNWTPSLHSLYRRFPSSQYHIKMMMAMIEHECDPVPVCAISFTYILDTLLILQSNFVQMWSCLETRGNDVQQHEQRTYSYELSRVLQKNTLLQPMITYPFNPVSFYIEPVLYYSL